MDNLTHSLVGWALAETGLKKRTRKGLAACILAANMPDIDVFFGWAPWAPLAMHRGFTHGLIGGVLVLPPVLAVLLWLLDRWQAARGRIASDAGPMHFGWLVALCFLGAITHPLLDLQNTYAVQLLAPASTRWFHADGLYIVSPWLLAMLGTGIALARRKARQSHRPAILALAATVLFITLNIGVSTLAWAAPAASPAHASPDRVFAAPEPLAFWRREVVWRQDGRIARGDFDPLHDPFALTGHDASQPDNMADPLAQRAALATPAIVKFLAWAQMPVASIARHSCTATVTFSDARFTGPVMSRKFTIVTTVPSGAPGCVSPMKASNP